MQKGAQILTLIFLGRRYKVTKYLTGQKQLNKVEVNRSPTYGKNVFSAGIGLIQFISRLCLCYCSPRLKACFQGICDWIVNRFLSLSLSTLAFAFDIPRHPPVQSLFPEIFLMLRLVCLFILCVCLF